MRKIKSLILTLNCLLVHIAFSQSDAIDSSFHSYAIREFYQGYDSVLVYRRTCALSDIGNSLILAKNDKQWRAFSSVEQYEYDPEKDIETFKKIKIKRYKLDQTIIKKTVAELINHGLLQINQDSLDYCESKSIEAEDGTVYRSTIMTLDGCGFRLESIFNDWYFLLRASGSIEKCYQLTQSRHQEKFLKCQDLIKDRLSFRFDE